MQGLTKARVASFGARHRGRLALDELDNLLERGVERPDIRSTLGKLREALDELIK